MVPWTHLREPFWENVGEQNSKFTLLIYIIIRLRKVKQSAIRFCTIFSRSCCPCRPWQSSFAQVKLHGTVWNWFLSQDRNSVDNMAFTDHGRLEATCFQVWSTFSSWFSGEVERFVHLIRVNLNSLLMPIYGFDRLPSLRGSNAWLSF